MWGYCYFCIFLHDVFPHCLGIFANAMVRYQLAAESVTPVYQVELPELLPLNVLMHVEPSLELMRTRYSWLLSDAYEAGGLLNLWFQENNNNPYWSIFLFCWKFGTIPV